MQETDLPGQDKEIRPQGCALAQRAKAGPSTNSFPPLPGNSFFYFYFYFEAAAAVAGLVSKLFSWSQPSLGFNFFLQLFAVPELAFSSLIYVPAAHPPRSAQRATTDGATTTTQRTTAPGSQSRVLPEPSDDVQQAVVPPPRLLPRKARGQKKSQSPT
jgi:hypothetical protein